MTRVILGYTKIILTKVSFDVNLFKLEFSKASKRLLSYEVSQLVNWAKIQFKDSPQLQTYLLEVEQSQDKTNSIMG